MQRDGTRKDYFLQCDNICTCTNKNQYVDGYNFFFECVIGTEIHKPVTLVK